jgi:hypothetical protein
MASVLARIGRTHITVHGFRHTFSDLAAERTGYANHVVEMALAHVVGNKVEAAYCRGDLLDRRRRLMADWVRYCGANPTELSGKVTANSTGAMKMVPRRRLSEWLLRPGRGMRPWIDALLKVDRNNDVAPLVSLLRSSSTPLPQDGRRHIADMLERYRLVRKRGGRQTPSYDRSLTEARLIWARDAIRKERKSGQTLDENIKQQARVHGVSADSLRAFVGGRHGSARRMQKRRSRL